MGNMEKNPSEMTINQAAKWYARLQSPDCTETDLRDFALWLKKHPSHLQAYESVRSAANMVHQLAADPRMAALSQDALKTDGRHRSKAPGFLSNPLFSGQWARAFAAAVVCLGVFVVMTLSDTAGLNKKPDAELYVNNGVAKQRVDLNDGSVIYLDVGTSISVSLSKNERLIELQQGRALFDVAKDSNRPFAVNAVGSRVVALGTRFQVAVHQREVDVVLAEGSVAVTAPDSPKHWREVLVPGEKLVIDAGANSPVKTQIDAELITGWVNGLLNFDGMPLIDVLAEVNRYARIKVVLGDDTLAAIPISGKFIAGGDTHEFVETLTSVLPLTSVRTGANEIVLFQTHELPRN